MESPRTKRAQRRLWPVTSIVKCDSCAENFAKWRAGFDKPLMYVCEYCLYQVLLNVLGKTKHGLLD